MRVLFLGEIVGKAGLEALKSLKSFRTENHIDYVVANGEGTTGGFGLGKLHALQLLKQGIDVVTGGEKILFKVDMVSSLEKFPRVLRPYNYSPDVPGNGWKTDTVNGEKLVVINLLGMCDFQRPHLGNPFKTASDLAEKFHNLGVNNVFIQYHFSATGEGLSFFGYLDGKASAVIGTHKKVLTADAQVSKRGTAYISDNGRCGSFLSVGGFDPENEIKKYITSVPFRSMPSFERIELQGVIVETDKNGKAVGIETVRIPVVTPVRGEDDE